MSQTTHDSDEPKCLAINKKGISGGRDALHNQVKDAVRETQEIQHISEEAPFN